MADRELLELAAKAAGIKEPFVQDMRGWGEVRHGFSEAIYDDERGEYWNPLTDDGDALRLAVKLALNGAFVIGISGDEHATAAGDHSEVEGAEVKHGDDPYAATRRAIVRAAAEIGRLMP